mgnify:CR=1 FL=1
MPNIATINGIAEDNVATYNGGTAALYTSKNGDTWVHNVAPTNPADNMVDFGESSSQTVTFAGATDDGTVTHYLVDNISNGILTVSTAEVSAGSAHTFNSGAVSTDTTISFRVRAKDNNGEYSSGVTMNTIISNALFQGQTYGYLMGGSTTNVIQKISLSSATTNFANVADLTYARSYGRCTHSGTHGYANGGSSSTRNGTIIDKHQFSTSNNSTNVGDLTVYVRNQGEASSSTDGYSQGGENGVNDAGQRTIHKNSFSSDGNATDIGDTTVSVGQHCGFSDWTNQYGYAAGGYGTSVGRTNVIDRFSFASGSQNSSDVGDLAAATAPVAGSNSTTHGYIAGGHTSGPVATIGRFAFGSSSNSSNIGSLTGAKYNGVAFVSTSYGYFAGGTGGNVCERWAFSSSANGVDVGDLLASTNTGPGATQI